MRDLVITLIVFGVLPFVIFRPHIGVLLWSWLGYMNPHRLTYGFAYNFPFAQLTAIFTIIGLLFSKEKKSFPINALTIVWILFIIWMCITTAFSMYPDQAVPQLIKVLKIQLVVLFSFMLFCDRERIHYLVWVIFISIGFFGIKGGVFTILTGGSYRVWGPSGSFISGNNEIALATLMVIPLANYLRETTENKWIKLGLLVAMLLMAASSMGSQSRGAFLAGACVLAYFWVKSKKKLVSGLAAVVVGIAVIIFMPESWHDRMQTIETYEEDASAMGRINAWTMATNLSLERFTGGGYEIWTRENFANYSPNPNAIHDAHSIYFEILGEHGFVGLFLFLIIITLTFRTCSKTIKLTKLDEELSWLNTLSKMVQVSLIAYVVGGAFLGMAYFDLFYHLVVIAVLGNVIANKETASRSSDTLIK